MTFPNKVKIAVNECGRGTVNLNGVNVDGCTGVSFQASADNVTQVTITFVAEVSAEVDVLIENLILKQNKLLDDLQSSAGQK